MLKFYIILFIIVVPQINFSQKFVPHFEYGIISIESTVIEEDSLGNNISERIRPLGTGFLLGHSDYFKGRIFLVTAKHIMKYVMSTLGGNLIIRLPYDDTLKLKNIKSIKFETYISDTDSYKVLYPRDPCYDVAVLDLTEFKLYSIDVPYFNEFGLAINPFVVSNILSNKDTLYPTQPIILGGYPLGLSGVYRNYIIYRYGIISAIITDKYEELCGAHYFINTETIGGDSGSPVFAFPMDGSQSYELKLIGVMKGSYFTGLNVVEPISEVMKIIDDYLQTIK